MKIVAITTLLILINTCSTVDKKNNKSSNDLLPSINYFIEEKNIGSNQFLVLGIDKMDNNGNYVINFIVYDKSLCPFIEMNDKEYTNFGYFKWKESFINLIIHKDITISKENLITLGRPINDFCKSIQKNSSVNYDPYSEILIFNKDFELLHVSSPYLENNYINREETSIIKKYIKSQINNK